LRKETTKSAIIKRNLFTYFLFIITPAVLLTTILSIEYLDTRIAVKVMQLIQSVHTLRKATESIPDLLLHFVVTATVLMWAFYLYRLHQRRVDAVTQFLKFAATVLPVAYLIKTLLKFVFGRTSIRGWLLENEELNFHWFKRWSSSFPSGHMLVFAAFGTAILIYYPKYQKIVLIFLILLGAALVGTDYHFLSDVIAGTYLGILTAYILCYLFEKQKIKS
jgi:membrane-associated phospholipid phosphatase